MYYYSLEKYIKKPEQLEQSSPHERASKSFRSHNDSKRTIIPDPDTSHILKARRERNSTQLGPNKDLFKKVRLLNNDYAEALELAFSYQFNLSNLSLELAKTVEKVMQTVLGVSTQSASAGNVPMTQRKLPSAQNENSSKIMKSPLEIEVNSVVHGFQKLHEELFNLVTDIIPRKERSVSRGKSIKSSKEVLREINPFEKSKDIHSKVVDSKTPRGPLASHISPRMKKPKTSISIQNIFEQNQKENMEMSRLSQGSQTSRINIANGKVSFSKNLSETTRGSSAKDAAIPFQRAGSTTTRLSEPFANILSELKGDVRNTSERGPSRIGLDAPPQKELEEDEIRSLSGTVQTGDETETPTISFQRVEDKRFLTNLVNGTTVQLKDEALDIAKMEKGIIKRLMKRQSPICNTSDHKIVGNNPTCLSRFLIDAKWWTAWKEYVSFDSKHSGRSKSPVQLYPRPERIINKDLIDPRCIDGDEVTGGELREHLLEHHDFESVTKEVFENLATWYGCDFEIIRLLKSDPSCPNKFYLDLYPRKRTQKSTNKKSLPENWTLKK